jgi:multisubunit Na+/H+ antiporter MnhG subunit
LTLVDLLIFILLVLSVGFGGIGVIGILLFPDTRSRMYTATRAAVISISAMACAVIFYAFFMLAKGGDDRYFTLIFHILILLGIVIVANVLMQWTILRRRIPQDSCHVSTEIRKEQE